VESSGVFFGVIERKSEQRQRQIPSLWNEGKMGKAKARQKCHASLLEQFLFSLAQSVVT
jgi:hypothetical protein